MYKKKIKTLRSLLLMLSISFGLSGCTGMASTSPQDGNIVAQFVRGVPTQVTLKSGVTPSNSCIAIDRSQSTVDLGLRISARDENGLDYLSINTSRRSGLWLPTITINTASPNSRIIRGGAGENRLVFTESLSGEDSQLSAVYDLSLSLELQDTSFDNPAEIYFSVTDKNGNTVQTNSIDLRRVLDPPPVTTTGVFVCMNGTAR